MVWALRSMHRPTLLQRVRSASAEDATGIDSREHGDIMVRGEHSALAGGGLPRTRTGDYGVGSACQLTRVITITGTAYTVPESAQGGALGLARCTDVVCDESRAPTTYL